MSNEIVLKAYPAEIEPEIHNGLTITNYLKEFEFDSKKSSKGCFVPEVKKWVVESTIYLRPRDDAAIVKGRPRWQEIKNFNCTDKKGLFNTYEGSLVHEKEHFRVRDEELNKFWKVLKVKLARNCEATKQKAEMKTLAEIEKFLKIIKKIDTEAGPRRVENLFYIDEYQKLTGRSCSGSNAK